MQGIEQLVARGRIGDALTVARALPGALKANWEAALKPTGEYLKDLERIKQLSKMPEMAAPLKWEYPRREPAGEDGKDGKKAAKEAVEASQAYRKLLETQLELAQPMKEVIRLTKEQEVTFGKWYGAMAKVNELDLDPDAWQHFYDWRAFWRSSGEPGPGEALGEVVADDFRRHFPDAFKLAGHPTYPKEKLAEAKHAEERLLEWQQVAYKKYADLFRKTHILPYGEWAVEIKKMVGEAKKATFEVIDAEQLWYQRTGESLDKVSVAFREHFDNREKKVKAFVGFAIDAEELWRDRTGESLDEVSVAFREHWNRVRDTTQKTTQAVALIWENALRGIQSAWSNAIYSMMKGMAGFADFLKSTWDAILQSISELIAAHVAKWIADLTGLARALEKLSKKDAGGIGDVEGERGNGNGPSATFKASPELLEALSYFSGAVALFEIASGNWVNAAVSLIATIALQRMAAAAQVSAAAGQASAAVGQVTAATTNSAAAAISTVAATTSVAAGGLMGAAMGVGVAAAVGMAAAAATMMAAAVIMAGVNVGLGLFGLQHGGLVTKPTVALLGERGPELVTPLSQVGAGVGGTIVVNQRVTVDSLDESNLRRLARRTVGATGHELWRARLRRSGGIA